MAGQVAGPAGFLPWGHFPAVVSIGNRGAAVLEQPPVGGEFSCRADGNQRGNRRTPGCGSIRPSMDDGHPVAEGFCPWCHRLRPVGLLEVAAVAGCAAGRGRRCWSVPVVIYIRS